MHRASIYSSLTQNRHLHVFGVYLASTRNGSSIPNMNTMLSLPFKELFNAYQPLVVSFSTGVPHNPTLRGHSLGVRASDRCAEDAASCLAMGMTRPPML